METLCIIVVILCLLSGNIEWAILWALMAWLFS